MERAAERPWTIRDHVQATAARIIGSPDGLKPRRERMLALIFDGKPLGDYVIERDCSKEVRKRLDEMLGLAAVIVGAEVESEIASLTSLAPRAGIATADFEVFLNAGNIIKLELCRLSDKSEKLYVDAISEIARRAERSAGESVSFDAILGDDTILVRFYGEIPTAKDIAQASEELREILIDQVASARSSTRFYPADERFPNLKRLGMRWARDATRHPARVMVEPMHHIVRPDLAASFLPMFSKKAKKFDEYSSGKPVWLAFYGDTGVTFPIAAIDSIACRNDFDPFPFARVLVGCFTAGVIFQRGLPPRYRCYSKDG